MIRWLDGLGAFKWPSILLIASPIVAYPSWAPDSSPAEHCGRVMVDGRLFEIYRSTSADQFILRPSQGAPVAARVIKVNGPLGFDAGGIVVDSEELSQAGHACSHKP